MSLFAVTFRIAYDTEARYDRVYSSLIKAIKEVSENGYWDDPTSFFLITSSKSSADLADLFVAKSHFDADKDHLLVINLSVTKGHASKGKLVDPDLPKLMGLRT